MRILDSIRPRCVPPLDEGFLPAALASRALRRAGGSGGTPLVIGLERADRQFSRHESHLLPESQAASSANLYFAERLVKFLLWQRGAFRVYVGGPQAVGEHIRQLYAPGGAQKFDYHFMGEQVHERPLEVLVCTPERVPPAHETGQLLGRHLEGCRIGFDLGASDRKVSAVADGRVVYSEEVVWEPRKHSDPEYHHRHILAALQAAAAHLPRVDAIGGSSAGIYIDNRPMVASLFRAVPADRFEQVRDMFVRIQREMGVPLEVINDGDVTALAGSMSLEDNGVLGIALGSSEAAGYVDLHGHITGWLNELAFAPVDYSPTAPVEEWSGDRGCGASYFSQQAVFRLAPQAGIAIPPELTDADKLKLVQDRLEAGHDGAIRIWQSMGIYLGYGLAHYADFYDIRHVLILGRCTSGRGGDLLLEGAGSVLRTEFPELAERLQLHLPDEKVRRIGQAVAAASLPALTS